MYASNFFYYYLLYIGYIFRVIVRLRSSLVKLTICAMDQFQIRFCGLMIESLWSCYYSYRDDPIRSQFCLFHLFDARSLHERMLTLPHGGKWRYGAIMYWCYIQIPNSLSPNVSGEAVHTTELRYTRNHVKIIYILTNMSILYNIKSNWNRQPIQGVNWLWNENWHENHRL